MFPSYNFVKKYRQNIVDPNSDVTIFKVHGRVLQQ